MKNNTFDGYIKEWLANVFNGRDDAEELYKQMFYTMEYSDEDVGEDETYTDFLLYLDADIIWKKLINTKNDIAEIPNCQDFIVSMITDIVDSDLVNLSFFDLFVSDMAYHIEDCDDASGFFQDMSYGGCVNGTVGMLIYHSDCKRIYVDNLDDMEYWLGYLENQFGLEIRNTQKLPRYTFVCWTCYEEFCHMIATTLFPDKF